MWFVSHYKHKIDALRIFYDNFDESTLPILGSVVNIDYNLEHLRRILCGNGHTVGFLRALKGRQFGTVGQTSIAGTNGFLTLSTAD